MDPKEDTWESKNPRVDISLNLKIRNPLEGNIRQGVLNKGTWVVFLDTLISKNSGFSNMQKNKKLIRKILL